MTTFENNDKLMFNDTILGLSNAIKVKNYDDSQIFNIMQTQSTLLNSHKKKRIINKYKLNPK